MLKIFELDISNDNIEEHGEVGSIEGFGDLELEES